MEMKNMKLSKEDSEKYPEMAAMERPEYPYGLRLDLQKEALEKLGIQLLPSVGQEMILMAKVKVCCVSQYDSEGGESSTSMGLQITDMALEKDSGKPDATSKLYGG